MKIHFLLHKESVKVNLCETSRLDSSINGTQAHDRMLGIDQPELQLRSEVTTRHLDATPL